MRGFTIIELMVAILVLLVLVALAVPSLQAVRQRAATRAAGDQLLSFWNQARLEAAKRNQLVKVGVTQSDSGATFCLGDSAADNGAWNGTKLIGVTLGGSNWPTVAAIEPAVIESKRTSLTQPADVGTITLRGPDGPKSYQIRLNVDELGRAVLCEPTAAPDKIGEYATRRC
jgi:prepilin-type N-terminal cleavage/methylation domain-containing protein